MGLQTLEYLRKKRRQRDKNNTKAVQNKRLEYRVLLEVREVLEKHLESSDTLMIEVDDKVLTQFVNILSDKTLQAYDYEQRSQNQFVFYNKEILL